MEVDDKNNFKESYKKLTNSLDSNSDRANYATWLILGVIIGRFYQRIKTVQNSFRKKNRK